jgi:PPOX class probable FMN-dependent enzyme
MNDITGPETLRAHYGSMSMLAARKVLRGIDRHARAFIGLSPFLVLATNDAEGHVDASPRGDAPGFVLVLDEATLLLPDRPGNNRVDSYGNILAGGGVGLLFFVPGVEETLRVNGRARVTTDPALLAPAIAQGKVPKAGLVITVEEVFFHCAKALRRARLWEPATQVPRSALPTLGQILADQTKACAVEEAERVVEESYRTKMY